ncbi:hypothetical protein IKE82_00990 [Candidatus Saccharibacteria bacterium]|nr:hypothetical protein [Candidatus Saccharibacteria bacterium]
MKLDRRTKDSIFKLSILFGVMMALTIVLALILNYLTPAASLVEEAKLAKEMLTEVVDADEIVVDESESESEKDWATPLAEETTVESETEQPDVPLFETEGDYSGAPSDVPAEALHRPEAETELVDEAKNETEAGSETEAEVQAEVKIEETSESETEVETEAQTEPKTTEEMITEYPYDEDKAVALAQLAWAEARGCSKREQSLVMWTVLNRVDAQYSGMTDFWSILTAPYQFAYSPNNPYEQYEYEIAADVLRRYAAEKDGIEESGRTLPKGYLYYWGDGSHNYFGMNGFSNELWFGLGDPYENW